MTEVLLSTLAAIATTVTPSPNPTPTSTPTPPRPSKRTIGPPEHIKTDMGRFIWTSLQAIMPDCPAWYQAALEHVVRLLQEGEAGAEAKPTPAVTALAKLGAPEPLVVDNWTAGSWNRMLPPVGRNKAEAVVSLLIALASDVGQTWWRLFERKRDGTWSKEMRAILKAAGIRRSTTRVLPGTGFFLAFPSSTTPQHARIMLREHARNVVVAILDGPDKRR